MKSVYEQILKQFDFKNRIKIIGISNYLGYYILTHKYLWDNIEIYNPKGYKYIFDLIKEINNCPKKVLCVACSKIKINLDHFDLCKLNHLDISNSKINLNDLVKILYRTKLEKLYLKRINFYNIMCHIINTQSDTLQELDLSISKKCNYNLYKVNNLKNINKLKYLKILKINNNNVSFEIFTQILKLPNLEKLEMIDCLINQKSNLCFCSRIKKIREPLIKLKEFKISGDFLCRNTMNILKLYLNSILIV